MDAQDAEAGRVPKKRVITAARKEQNRIAQRTFRQRQKELRLQREQARDKCSERKLEPRLVPGPSAQNDTDAFWETLENVEAVHGIRASSGSSHVRGSPELCSAPSQILAADEPDDFWALDAPLTPLTTLSLQPLLMPSGSPNDSPPEQGTHQEHPRNTPPDLRANTLQLNRSKVLAACLQNALCLGLDPARFRACHSAYMSPFYRPVGPLDDLDAIVSSLSDPAVPAHLRPTPAQVMVPHYACLDLLPLPRLRERVIMLAAAVPSRFSLWDLKLDIFVRDAVACWRRREMCQPWDMGSWEPAPWFLKKWCLADSEPSRTLSWH